MVTDFAQVTTQQSVSNHSRNHCPNSDAATRRHQRSPCMTESSKTPSVMTTGTKGDDDKCGVDGPTLSTS